MFYIVYSRLHNQPVTNTMAYAHPIYHGGMNHVEQMTSEHLTCKLCHVPGYRSPKILPKCGHTFCAPCLERYINNAAPTPRRRPLQMPCPLCGIMNTVPAAGVRGLPNNLFIDVQIDRLLMRHNQDRGRNDARYDISQYVMRRCLCRVKGEIIPGLRICRQTSGTNNTIWNVKYQLKACCLGVLMIVKLCFF